MRDEQMRDEQLRAVFAELVEQVWPMPAPLARLQTLHRRDRRRRAMAIGAVMAVALVATSLVATGIGGAARQSELSGDERATANRQVWVDRLVNGPARGGLAADHSFVTALTQALNTRQQTSDTGVNPALRSAKVLFVDDIDKARVAIVVFRQSADSPRPDGTRERPHTPITTWLVAERGAAPQTLAAALRPGNYGWQNGLMPFQSDLVPLGRVTEGGGAISIGLAPPGCQVSSADLPSVTQWRAEPTGSYVVRTAADRRPEWWRVTCAEVIRSLAPAPINDGGTAEISDAELDRALAGAGGIDRATVRSDVSMTAQVWGYTVTARPTLVWAGAIPDGEARNERTNEAAPMTNAWATVVAAPRVGGGWIGQAMVHHDPLDNGHGSSSGYGVSFQTSADPTGPDEVLAIQVWPQSTGGTPTAAATSPRLRGLILTIVPEATARVRVLRDGRPEASAEVRHRSAVLWAGLNAKGISIETTDAAGRTTGTAALVEESMLTGTIDAWGDD